MRGLCLIETRLGRDVCHQRYVRADKSALTLCVLPNLGPDQMWAHITGFIYSKNNTTLHRHGSTITYTYTYLSSVIVSCRIVAVVQWVSSAPVRIVVSDELAHCRIVMIPRRQEIVDFCR